MQNIFRKKLIKATDDVCNQKHKIVANKTISNLFVLFLTLTTVSGCQPEYAGEGKYSYVDNEKTDKDGQDDTCGCNSEEPVEENNEQNEGSENDDHQHGGGGGGDGGNYDWKYGSIQLGKVSNAEVKIKTLDGIVLYSTYTDSDGNFYYDLNDLKNKLSGYTREYLLIETSGGIDQDPNIDGLSIEESKNIVKPISGYVELNRFFEGNVKANLITSRIYDLLKGDFCSDDELRNNINTYTAYLGMIDKNNDNIIDNDDNIDYDMIDDESQAEDKLKVSYLRSFYEKVQGEGQESAVQTIDNSNEKYDVEKITGKIFSGEGLKNEIKLVGSGEGKIYYAFSEEDLKLGNGIEYNNLSFTDDQIIYVFEKYENGKASKIQKLDFSRDLLKFSVPGSEKNDGKNEIFEKEIYEKGYLETTSKYDILEYGKKYPGYMFIKIGPNDGYSGKIKYSQIPIYLYNYEQEKKVKEKIKNYIGSYVSSNYAKTDVQEQNDVEVISDIDSNDNDTINVDKDNESPDQDIQNQYQQNELISEGTQLYHGGDYTIYTRYNLNGTGDYPAKIWVEYHIFSGSALQTSSFEFINSEQEKNQKKNYFMGFAQSKIDEYLGGLTEHQPNETIPYEHSQYRGSDYTIYIKYNRQGANKDYPAKVWAEYWQNGSVKSTTMNYAYAEDQEQSTINSTRNELINNIDNFLDQAQHPQNDLISKIQSTYNGYGYTVYAKYNRQGANKDYPVKIWGEFWTGSQAGTGDFFECNSQNDENYILNQAENNIKSKIDSFINKLNHDGPYAYRGYNYTIYVRYNWQGGGDYPATVWVEYNNGNSSNTKSISQSTVYSSSEKESVKEQKVIEFMNKVDVESYSGQPQYSVNQMTKDGPYTYGKYNYTTYARYNISGNNKDYPCKIWIEYNDGNGANTKVTSTYYADTPDEKQRIKDQALQEFKNNIGGYKMLFADDGSNIENGLSESQYSTQQNDDVDADFVYKKYSFSNLGYPCLIKLQDLKMAELADNIKILLKFDGIGIIMNQLKESEFKNYMKNKLESIKIKQGIGGTIENYKNEFVQKGNFWNEINADAQTYLDKHKDDKINDNILELSEDQDKKMFWINGGGYESLEYKEHPLTVYVEYKDNFGGTNYPASVWVEYWIGNELKSTSKEEVLSYEHKEEMKEKLMKEAELMQDLENKYNLSSNPSEQDLQKMGEYVNKYRKCVINGDAFNDICELDGIDAKQYETILKVYYSASYDWMLNNDEDFKKEHDEVVSQKVQEKVTELENSQSEYSGEFQPLTAEQIKEISIKIANGLKNGAVDGAVDYALSYKEQAEDIIDHGWENTKKGLKGLWSAIKNPKQAIETAYNTVVEIKDKVENLFLTADQIIANMDDYRKAYGGSYLATNMGLSIYDPLAKIIKIKKLDKFMDSIILKFDKRTQGIFNMIKSVAKYEDDVLKKKSKSWDLKDIEEIKKVSKNQDAIQKMFDNGEIYNIIKTNDGKIVWLAKGGESNGFDHIFVKGRGGDKNLSRYEEFFKGQDIKLNEWLKSNYGYEIDSPENMMNFVEDVVKKGEFKGGSYEIKIYGDRRMQVGTNTNGYINTIKYLK